MDLYVCGSCCLLGALPPSEEPSLLPVIAADNGKNRKSKSSMVPIIVGGTLSCWNWYFMLSTVVFSCSGGRYLTTVG